jgi:hypothetical protein
MIRIRGWTRLKREEGGRLKCVGVKELNAFAGGTPSGRLRIVQVRPRDAKTHLVVDCWKLMGFSRIDGTSVLLLLLLC